MTPGEAKGCGHEEPVAGCRLCWHYDHTPGFKESVHGGPPPAAKITPQTQAPGRRLCVHLDATAYPATRHPAELVKPCGHKLRRCELYEEVCTLDPRPAANGPVPRDCLGCEQRGEGFEPRMS